MKRIVWIAAALLIMIGIMGYGLYVMRNISEVNRERREKEAAKHDASQIVMTTEATNIYDKLRPTEPETIIGENGQVIVITEPETTEDPGAMRPARATTTEADAPVIVQDTVEPETAAPMAGESPQPDTQPEPQESTD